MCEKLNGAHAGRPRQALGAVQLRRRGGGERGQDGPARHRASGRRGVRPRLPRSHQPHHGADREEHALQGHVRAVRRARCTGSRCPTRCAGPAAWRGARPMPSTSSTGLIDTQVGEDNLAARDHRTDPGRGRLHRPGAAASCPRWPSWCGQHGVLFIADEIQTGLLPHRRLVRLRPRRRRAGPGHHGQGHRRWPAAGRRHRPGRTDGRGARRAASAGRTAATRSRAPPRSARSRPWRPTT